MPVSEVLHTSQGEMTQQPLRVAAIAVRRIGGVLERKAPLRARLRISASTERSERGVPGEYADLENMTADELREQFAALVSAVAAAEGVGDTAAIAEGAGKGPPRGKPH
jgi:hypothetical protein